MSTLSGDDKSAKNSKAADNNLSHSSLTLFYREPRLVALMALVLIVAGLSALLALGRQEDPTITNLFANVTTVYPGADAERVESLVTDPIEEALQGIAEIDTLTSQSSQSLSSIQINLEETLDEVGIESAWTDIRAALEKTDSTLPRGAQSSQFKEGSGAWSSIIAIVPSASLDITTATRYAKVLADDLRRVTGTDEVKLFGIPEEQIIVDVDIEHLATMSLTLADVARAISAADPKVSAGIFRADQRNLLIEVDGELEAIEQIASIPLHGADGQVVQLEDVAQVRKGVRSPETEMARSNGRPAVLIAARIANGLQIDVWMSDVRATLDRFSAKQPVGLSHELVFDQSEYTAKRLTSVAKNMAIGIILVFAVLLITVGLRAAFIVALVLPLVSLAAIATMNLINLPLHQMSLTGLIVALGLLVDAAIVMTDEIGKRLAIGMRRVDAVEESVRRLWPSLLASTITTVLSFLPLALLPGGAGDFVGAIAVAVIIMLCWSFVIAMTITAALAGRMLSTNDPRKPLRSNRVKHVIAVFFRRLIGWIVRYPWPAIVLSLVLPLMGFASIPTLVQQFFPGVERDQFYLEVELGEGSSIARTASLTDKIDERLRREEGIEHVSWVIGKSAPRFYYNIVGNRDRAPNYSQALVRTVSANATAQLVSRLQLELPEAFPEARVIVRNLVQGPPVPAPVELRLVGPDLDLLANLGEQYRKLLSGLDTITTVRASLETGAPKLVLKVDETAAHLAGLGLVDVAQSIDSALEGIVGGSIIDGGETLPVRVRADVKRRAELERILDLPLRPANAPIDNTPSVALDAIPLSAIANVSLAPSQSSIARRNSERVNTVQGFIPYGLLPQQALDSVRIAIAEAGLEPPPGYRLEFGGDSDARNNTVNDLIASLGIIVTLSIAALVLSLGSFRLTIVTLIVALLSAGLSFLALAVFNYPFGINALIGVIGSIGVSINAALIILSGLKADEYSALGDPQAIVDVVVGSGRHIVSTTLTTFGGFLPLILGGGAFWPPFAMAIAGGVLLSTVVSFGFVPAVFCILYGHRPCVRQITFKDDCN